MCFIIKARAAGMKQTLFALLDILLAASDIDANTIQNRHIGMFATVVNVKKGDVLNVREKPNYHSKKLGEFHTKESIDYFAGGMQVEYCKKISKSTWCKVYPVVNINIGQPSDGVEGWVNARYLKFSNSGYVNVLNQKSNCDYSLKCKADKCLVLGYKRAKWIPKRLLGVEKGQKETSAKLESKAEGVNDDSTFCFYHFRQVLTPYLRKNHISGRPE